MSDAPGSAMPAPVTPPEADAMDELARRIPGPLGAIATQGHARAALDLIDAFGGTKLKIPAKPEGTNLADRIGLTATAALIAAACGPCEIRVPSKSCLAERKAAMVLDAIARGESNTDIARQVGVSDTYVSKLRKDGGYPSPKNAVDIRQLSLF